MCDKDACQLNINNDLKCRFMFSIQVFLFLSFTIGVDNGAVLDSIQCTYMMQNELHFPIYYTYFFLFYRIAILVLMQNSCLIKKYILVKGVKLHLAK